MDTSSYGAPTPSEATDTIGLWKAVDALVELGMSRELIQILSKLGAAGVHRVLDVFEQGNRDAVDRLLGPIEGVSEDALGSWFDAIAEKKSDSVRGRRLSQHPSRDPIDNQHNATLTPATPHLILPPTSSFRRSSSTRTRSASPASTKLTHPSSQKRQKVTPKTTRKQLYCPDCCTPIKNGFEKHFHKHLPHLLPQKVIGEAELIGCGYCDCKDPELDQGKAYQGVTRLLRHIHEEHTQADSQAPVQLGWDFNASFKNVLSAEVNIRRHFLSLVKEENRRIASKTPPYNVPPTLSWPPSPDTKQLLDELQALGGTITGVPYTQLNEDDAWTLKCLLTRAYEAAHKWQPSSTVMAAMPSRSAPVLTPASTLASAQSKHLPQQQRPMTTPQQANSINVQNNLNFAAMGQGAYDSSQYHDAQDTLNFAAMGQGAYDASQYPAFKANRALARHGGPSREVPFPQQSNSAYHGPGGDTDDRGSMKYTPSPSNPVFPLSAAAPEQSPNLDPFGLPQALNMDDSDIFRKYTNTYDD